MNQKLTYEAASNYADHLHKASEEVRTIVDTIKNEFEHVGSVDYWAGDIANNTKASFDTLANQLEDFITVVKEEANYLDTVIEEYHQADEAVRSGEEGIEVTPSEAPESAALNSNESTDTPIKTGIPGEDAHSKDGALNSYEQTKEEPIKTGIPGEDSYASDSATKARIADEIIAGKWGNGPARNEALRNAGYDAKEIQNIVNQKLNGTYTGPASAATPTSAAPTNDGPIKTGIPGEDTFTNQESVTVNQNTASSAPTQNSPFLQTIQDFDISKPKTNGSFEQLTVNTQGQNGLTRDYTNYEYFFSNNKWNEGTNQKALSEIWAATGKQADDVKGIAMLNGRYLVAMAPRFGNVGDNVNVRLENGQVIPCTIADTKSPSDSNFTPDGHKLEGGGISVVEWETTRSMTDADILGTEWRKQKVVAVDKTGTSVL